MVGTKKMRWFAALALIGVTTQLVAISAAEKAKEKMQQNRTYIYALEISILNFGTDEWKNEYTAVKNKYLTGLSLFMEDNYVPAYKELLSAQQDLEKLYEKVSMEYIARTQKILQELVKQAVDVDLKYQKGSDLANRTMDPREAPKEAPAYEPTEYHYFYDKKTIFRNIDMGFSLLGDAKRVHREAANFIDKYYEKTKKIDPSVYNYKIEQYLGVIELCRQAKQDAFYAYQLLNRNDIYTVQTEHRGNRFAREANLLPVFDPRIPDEYKVDASDARKLIHAEEVRIKLNGGSGKKQAPADQGQPSSGN